MHPKKSPYLTKVQQDPWLLQYIKDQTPEICLAAVQKNGHTLKYIDQKIPNKLDEENPLHTKFYELGWRNGDLNRVYIAAVKQNGYALQYIKNQNPEICLTAVQQEGYALRYVNNNIPNSDIGWRDGDLSRICLAAVRQEGHALQYVKDQTPEICLAAIQQEARALEYVQDVGSIALMIDRSVLDLDAKLSNIFGNERIMKKKIEAIIKIREAHQIAERVNESVDTVNHRQKVKL